MDVWSPFLQALIWPLFLAVFIVWQRKWVIDMTEIIKERIKMGGGFKTPIFELPPVLEAEETPEAKEFLEKVERDAKIVPGVPKKERVLSVELTKSLFLVHSAEVTNSRDNQRRPYYLVRVQLAAANPSLLDEVSSVEYHLHHTFTDPVRKVNNRTNSFELTLNAWGQFTIKANVYFKDSEQMVTLTRFLNF
ncbi:MAG: hypothetical protein K8R67_04985 [Desulfobacteraceae bacterium]|nr:hypothetical protein [Desulfobacteraceae bacterium]